MKKILVIEDEPEMRRNLTTILRLEKFHALPAAGGRIGIQLAKKEKPDLILCDVMMPELDGYGSSRSPCRYGDSHYPVYLPYCER